MTSGTQPTEFRSPRAADSVTSGPIDDTSRRICGRISRWRGRKSDGTNVVDFLINAKLDKLGLESAAPADRRTLIRRATFDLIGLPPTPREVEEFVNDSATDDVAFRKVIDRLLASPHYGEQ
ncbi:MAG: DUF1549 domain-containing protein, partial [Planctomycetota bacterium]